MAGTDSNEDSSDREDFLDEVVELPIDGALDLHTFDPRELGDLIPTWIEACREAGIFEVRIIHGKGRGMLRRSVHALLERNPDVVSFKLAPSELGGWGATFALLRRP